MKNVPCILVSSREQQENEQEYYQEVIRFQGNSQITRNYCAFWKKDHSGYYVEAFADILKRKFE